MPEKCPSLEDVFVVTDSDQIFDHVKNFGGKALMSSSKCQTGTDRLAEAFTNYKELSAYDLIINIQGDEPLLETAVIESVIQALQGSPDAQVSTAVAKITKKEEASHPSLVKCVMDKNDYALYFSRSLIPNGHKGLWQEGVTYYRHIGIYGYRKDFLLHYAKLPQTPLQIAEDLEQLKVLENGYRIKTAIVESCSIGVDHPEDINQIEKML